MIHGRKVEHPGLEGGRTLQLVEMEACPAAICDCQLRDRAKKVSAKQPVCNHSLQAGHKLQRGSNSGHVAVSSNSQNQGLQLIAKKGHVVEPPPEVLRLNRLEGLVRLHLVRFLLHGKVQHLGGCRREPSPTGSTLTDSPEEKNQRWQAVRPSAVKLGH